MKYHFQTATECSTLCLRYGCDAFEFDGLENYCRLLRSAPGVYLCFDDAKDNPHIWQGLTSYVPLYQRTYVPASAARTKPYKPTDIVGFLRRPRTKEGINSSVVMRLFESDERNIVSSGGDVGGVWHCSQCSNLATRWCGWRLLLQAFLKC